jgi:hypothetical protein
MIQKTRRVANTTLRTHRDRRVAGKQIVLEGEEGRRRAVEMTSLS